MPTPVGSTSSQRSPTAATRIHASLGAVDLVDATGPAALIRPLGLFCPLAFVLAAVVLARRKERIAASLVGVAGVL